LADARGVPAYVILGDASLRAMAAAKPASLEALGELPGWGAKKLADFGEVFIAALREDGPQGSRRAIGGWGLAEVLMACAVAALLAALSLPAYQALVARSKSATCLGNLRALGAALNLYLADHNMIMPVMEAGRSSRDEDVPVIDNTLDAYARDPRVFGCPADNRLFQKTGTSYFWNSTLSKPEPQNALRLNFLGLVTDLGRIPVLVDKEGWHRFSDNRVNHLFADGRVASELRLFAE
ncbi:MAG: HRDC domain-containing protein, partial [Terrimicrobiaceae bacterium]|nr:HRDC domain-containing protein [Terrimicrobiaceae bacterium]